MYLALGKYFKIFAVYVEGQSDSKGKKKATVGKKKEKSRNGSIAAGLKGRIRASLGSLEPLSLQIFRFRVN